VDGIEILSLDFIYSLSNYSAIRLNFIGHSSLTLMKSKSSETYVISSLCPETSSAYLRWNVGNRFLIPQAWDRKCMYLCIYVWFIQLWFWVYYCYLPLTIVKPGKH